MSRHFKIWSIYVMAAGVREDLTFFKVGITSNIPKRICAVQTGCPLPITMVWAIEATNNGTAQTLERGMHEMLNPFHSHGEWFAMRPADPEHKRAMNEAFAYAREACSQMNPVRWREMSVPDLKQAIREESKERLDSDKVKRSKQRHKALIQMITQRRRIL